MLAKIRREINILIGISKHPRLPWYVKVIAVATIAYALSPIDLIPDFIPVLGQLDDLIIIPIGIFLVYRLTPKDIIEEVRAKTK